jgi:hypothetical protein
MLFNNSLQAKTKEDYYIRAPKSVKETPSHIFHIHYTTFTSIGANIQELWDILSSIPAILRLASLI